MARSLAIATSIVAVSCESSLARQETCSTHGIAFNEPREACCEATSKVLDMALNDADCEQHDAEWCSDTALDFCKKCRHSSDESIQEMTAECSDATEYDYYYYDSALQLKDASYYYYGTEETFVDRCRVQGVLFYNLHDKCCDASQALGDDIDIDPDCITNFCQDSVDEFCRQCSSESDPNMQDIVDENCIGAKASAKHVLAAVAENGGKLGRARIYLKMQSIKQPTKATEASPPTLV